MNLKDVTPKEWAKFIIWALLYTLWVIWLGNYWWLLGLVVIFDIFISKKVKWRFWKKDGWYYLIFSHRGRGEYRMSRAPFSGWIRPENPEIPCESVPKGALWNGRILFTGFSRIEGYAGTLTFTEARQNPDGTLRF